MNRKNYLRVKVLLGVTFFLLSYVKVNAQNKPATQNVIEGNKILLKISNNVIVPKSSNFSNGLALSGSYLYDLNGKSKLLLNGSVGLNKYNYLPNSSLLTLITSIGYRRQIQNFSVNGNIGYMKGILGNNLFSVDLPQSLGFSLGAAYDIPLNKGRAISIFTDFHKYGEGLKFGSWQLGVGYNFNNKNER